MFVSTILSKTQSYLKKPTGNFITDKINNVKAKVLQKVTKKISDSKWPNSDSSFWKWLLTIIAVSIGIFGFVIFLIGLVDRLQGVEYKIQGVGYLNLSAIIMGIGLSFMLIGYLFLIWARNVQ